MSVERPEYKRVNVTVLYHALMNILHKYLVFSAVLIIKTFGIDNIGDRLIKEVFDGYQPGVRPLCDPYPFTVTPDLGLAIRQLIELDNPEQKLTTNIWFRMRWHDCRLTWNVSRYQNLARVVVPVERMWVPDLTLYQNAESKLGEKEKYHVSINHTGLIEYNLPAIVKSMCELNVAMFPFDSQVCNLTLGSWMYRIEEVNFIARKPNPADMNSFERNGEWDLSKFYYTEQVLQGFDGFNYSQVVFTLYLHRKPLYHVINLIVPSVIVKSLAFVGFLLPPECGEKLNLEITVLLSLLVFQLVILNSMPKSSTHLPVIAIYFLLSMVLIALSCVGTVVVLNIHFNKHHTPLPKCLRKIVTGRIGKLFRLSKLMGQTEEKLQRLRKEYKQSQQKHNPFSESKSIPTSEVLHNGPNRFTTDTDRFSPHISPGKRRGSEEDAIYGFHSSSVHNSYLDASSRHQTYSVPSQPGSGSISPVFSLDAPELQANALELQPKESAVMTLFREILAHLELKWRSEVKKQIHELNEIEWRLFAVFMDRFFMFMFFFMGSITGLVVFSYIALHP